MPPPCAQDEDNNETVSDADEMAEAAEAADVYEENDSFGDVGLRFEELSFVPPHELIERGCFSLGVQHHFRRKPREF